MAKTPKEISTLIDAVFYGYEKITIKKSVNNAKIHKNENLKRKDPTRSS